MLLTKGLYEVWRIGALRPELIARFRTIQDAKRYIERQEDDGPFDIKTPDGRSFRHKRGLKEAED